MFSLAHTASREISAAKFCIPEDLTSTPALNTSWISAHLHPHCPDTEPTLQTPELKLLVLFFCSYKCSFALFPNEQSRKCWKSGYILKKQWLLCFWKCKYFIFIRISLQVLQGQLHSNIVFASYVNKQNLGINPRFHFIKNSRTIKNVLNHKSCNVHRAKQSPECFHSSSALFGGPSWQAVYCSGAVPADACVDACMYAALHLSSHISPSASVNLLPAQQPANQPVQACC